MLDLRLPSLCPHTESLEHFFWKIILSIKIGASQMVCPQALSNLMSLHFQLTQRIHDALNRITMQIAHQLLRVKSKAETLYSGQPL